MSENNETSREEIGNQSVARSSLSFDLLARTLKALRYEVTMGKNIASSLTMLKSSSLGFKRL
ncbi:TPA: hypothetical protein EYP45_02680 [Candidatus Peregrinibacteria bacterium]|nr:hypothetical protein [Candidatus Peregrinibacteria bacterium]